MWYAKKVMLLLVSYSNFPAAVYAQYRGLGSQEKSDWEKKVGSGDFISAWFVLEGIIPKNSLALGVVDPLLGELALDPSWGSRYEAFRLWVWEKKGVWLMDSWSLAISSEFNDFSMENLFSVESSDSFFDGKNWLLDLEFMAMGTSGGSLAPRRVSIFNKEGFLSCSGEVAGAAELLSLVVSYMSGVVEWMESSGVYTPDLFDEEGLVVFVPSPGSMVFLELAIDRGLAELSELGMSVEKKNKVVEGRLVQCLLFTLPNRSIKFCFEGAAVSGELRVEKVDLSFWFL